MKTGIVRRIDDLGRVVIPKEIRRTMGLKEGDPLEIATHTENGKPQLILQKYNAGADYNYDTLIGILDMVADGEQYILCDANGEVIRHNTADMPAVVLNTVIKTNGYEVAFIKTADTPKGKRLADVVRVYMAQYD